MKDGDELVLSSNWVPSRVPVTFLLRDTGPLAAPTLRFDAGAKVTNPYPVPIKGLMYCDAQGGSFTLDAPLAPGATAVLTPCPKLTPAVSHPPIQRIFFDAEPFSYLRGRCLVPDADLTLRPKTYLCELDGSPLFAHPIRRGKIRHAGETLILGELK